jgi:hypothetical protein
MIEGIEQIQELTNQLSELVEMHDYLIDSFIHIGEGGIEFGGATQHAKEWECGRLSEKTVADAGRSKMVEVVMNEIIEVRKALAAVANPTVSKGEE